jgi:predicted nucleotidyltransferase
MTEKTNLEKRFNDMMLGVKSATSLSHEQKDFIVAMLATQLQLDLEFLAHLDAWKDVPADAL